MWLEKLIKEECCKGRFWEARFRSQALLDYLGLVEALGQVVRSSKRGYILPCHNTILELLNMNAEEWLKLSESFGGKFRCAVDSAKKLESYAQHTQSSWVSGKCTMMAYNL